MDFNDKIARASLHIEVADRVRDMIFDRSLPPGFRIDELELSAKLGTSRTPLREALKVLANEGLVRLAPGRGAFVTELSPRKWTRCFRYWRCSKRAASPRRSAASGPRSRRLEEIQERMEDHARRARPRPSHRD